MSNCTHRWRIETPEPLVPTMGAECRLCGATRAYHKLIDDQYDYNSPRVPDTMHLAANRRVR